MTKDKDERFLFNFVNFTTWKATQITPFSNSLNSRANQ